MLSRRRNKAPVKEQRTDSIDHNDTPLRTNTKPTTFPATRERVATATNGITQNSGPQHLNMPAIYAAPTVDTLDDESLFLDRAHLWAGNINGRKNGHASRQDDEQSGVMRHHVSFTPNSINPSNSFNHSTYSYHHTAYSPTRAKFRADQPQSSATSEQEQSQAAPQEVTQRQTKTPAQKLQARRKRKKQQPRDFQHEEDAMKVTVRSIDVAQRAAFASRTPVSIEEWHSAAHRVESKNKTSSSLANANKKLSPSLQLLNLLHSMQALSTIRQLNFSPSVGIDSDAFVPWWEDALLAGDGSSTANKESKLKRRSSSIMAEQRDGRYRSIHPVQATLSTLPATPPSLSNKKARLPMRADVGFPNASEEEIRKKTAEINRETEWEEASPRLIVLVTGDDLGTSVQEENADPIIPPEHWEWNGGGLHGMPYAGRELLRAKELNALHFSRKSSILSKTVASSKSQHEAGNQKKESHQSTKQRFLEPNRTSVLAPPLDASHSKTLGWRPRPFHDRQPGMQYLLSWPLDISFDAGNLEPLLCSLALYNLPNRDSAGSGGLGACGKISEEFWFPAGDWSGKIEVDQSSLNIPTANGTEISQTVMQEEELKDSWIKHKQKAIFSYDPHVIKGGRRSLFWVLQVYKVANDEMAAAYLSKDSNFSNKKSNGVKKLFKGKPPTRPRSGSLHESFNGEQCHAGQFFEKFGTKMMTPLAFGVQSILEGTGGNGVEKNAKVEFPRGSVRELKLWATAHLLESQEEFVLRLCKLASKRDSSPEESWQPFGDAGLVLESTQLQSEFSHASDGSGAFDMASIASSVSDRSAANDSVQMTSSSSFKSAESKQKGSSPGPKKKSLKQRIWMSPAKASRSLKNSSQSLHKAASTTASRSTSSTSSNCGEAKQTNISLAATARVFTSVLDTDWLEAMLKEPTDLDGFQLCQHPQSTGSPNMPKILCDVSGDFAVMLEDRGSGKKRSNLIRTPPHTLPAGYTGASEIREVLFLPARPEKQYDVDIPPSFRSLLNLLYLYPLLLRYGPDQPNGNKQKKQDLRPRYTVRVRLIRSSIGVDQTGTIASSQEALQAFHSPSPWTGSPLLEEVYTKIPSQASLKQQKDSKAEQPMRDEFKLRLPTILDGTFFLHFTLLELDPDFNLRTVAENSVPLSSSSARDSAGGSKVATCIPNGCHRVKLGEFRLYVESRLVSSIHIADAAVVAAVRDFPIRQSAKESNRTLESTPFSIASFPSQFSTASGGTLVAHFQLLLYIHLGTLLEASGRSSNQQTVTTRESMMGSVRSLFEILRKVKARLDPGGQQTSSLFRTGTRTRLDTFLKIAVDEFEEHFLDLPGQSSNKRLDEKSSELGSDIDLGEVPTGSSAIEDDEMEEEFLDEGAVSFRKDSLRHGIDRRLSRRISQGFGASSVTSISRVAYGASKTDRLKVEAERYYDAGRFPHLFEDDETIVTSGTSLHNLPDSAALGSPQNNESKAWTIDQTMSLDDLYSERSIKEATAAASRAIESNTNDSTSASLDEGFATRVKTVATVMLAPCVGNGKAGSSPRRLSLDCGRSARRRRKDSNISKEKVLDEATTKASDEKPEMRRGQFVFPGSDAEDDDEEQGQSSIESRYTSFRGRISQPLVFNGRGRCLDESDNSILGGKHVYESLVVLWLQVWLEQNSEAKADIPAFDSPATSSVLLMDFFRHKDILLPLILKSIALRHRSEHSKAVLDTSHISVLKQFVGMLASCVMGQALAHSHRSSAHSGDSGLLTALASSDVIVDFFKGLFAVLHPDHMRSLMAKYFKTLRDCETELSKEKSDEGLLEFEWTQQSIHRVKSSRQLRLRALEKLAVMPSFLALNFPLKYSDRFVTVTSRRTEDSTWKIQYHDTGCDPVSTRHESGDTQRPASGWLARLLADEACSICALSCEAVVAQAIAHIEHAEMKSSLGKLEESKKKLQLQRNDLLMFQSLATHSISSLYELLLRRHSMDRRFQTDTCRGRIAALYAEILFAHSLQSVRWLARMESTHKIRSIWMLCLVYVLQEAPEILIRDLVRSYCDPSDILIHRFIRLLRLGSSTFQSFVDQSRHSTFPNEIDESISPWLLQESFNTILNATNIVVEECVALTESNPYENKKLFTSVLDLFLHILTTPQSAVTHLRAVGGALQALEQFGVAIFLDAVGNTMQHWLRIIVSLMNSTSLSVRSISVDFVVSLLGSAYDLLGNVDDILLVFVSVVPEVVAREIGLFSVDGHVCLAEDLERSIWPLRRSFADLEDANPLDDDRIDPELSPVLKTWCRASQAILDGVLIELRLRGDKCLVIGTQIKGNSWETHAFDADEESLVEAANFFLPETAPLQRIRWLRTLKALHEAKGQWLEAAEAMMACASTICDALPHLDSIWRPSAFLLWQDARRSTWLQTVGEEIGHPDRGNAAVVAFYDEFLEPRELLASKGRPSTSEKLPKPTMAAMCNMLTSVTKEAVNFYLREEGMEELAYARLENLLRILMDVLSDQSALGLEYRRNARNISIDARKRQVEEEALLRRVTATLSGVMVGLLVEEEQEAGGALDTNFYLQDKIRLPNASGKVPFYILVSISGYKPPRFQESTTLPTFLEWNMPCVCRVPTAQVEAARRASKSDANMLRQQVCLEYGKVLKAALFREMQPDSGSVELTAQMPGGEGGTRDPSKTFIDMTVLDIDIDMLVDPSYHQQAAPGGQLLESKRLFYKKTEVPNPIVLSQPESAKVIGLPAWEEPPTIVEVTVAHTFPSILSRQRALLTSEFKISA